MKSINASDTNTRVADWLIDNAIDITAPFLLNVQINEHTGVVHVNCNGICVLRACRIKHLRIEHTNAQGVPL